MLERRIRTLAVTGIMTVAAALVTLGTTAASAAPTTASTPAHVTAPRAAEATSGCVTETFTEADEPYYEQCVADEQILLNDIWYSQENTEIYLGVIELLTVDGSYGPDTTSDVEAFQGFYGDEVDGKTGPMTWGTLCSSDYYLGYHGTYWNDAGCATEPGL
jgi:hypothetical protein